MITCNPTTVVVVVVVAKTLVLVWYHNKHANNIMANAVVAMYIVLFCATPIQTKIFVCSLLYLY